MYPQKHCMIRPSTPATKAPRTTLFNTLSPGGQHYSLLDAALASLLGPTVEPAYALTTSEARALDSAAIHLSEDRIRQIMRHVGR
jgi:hypothetical protein